jgi:hypothetical protein
MPKRRDRMKRGALWLPTKADPFEGFKAVIVGESAEAVVVLEVPGNDCETDEPVDTDTSVKEGPT